MPGKKVSRKKLLKEPDEFFSTTGKIIQYIRSHRRHITLYGIIVVAVVVAGLGGYSYLLWQEGKAQAIQQQALQQYQEAFFKGSNADGEKDNYQKAMKKFREALAVYSRGNVSQVSQIYIGHCHFALKEYDQAVAAYSRCLEGPFRAMAFDGLAHCYESKGNFAKAVENYQKNMEEDRSPFQGEGLLGAARCYEALNQKQKALEIYQKALARNPNSRMAEFIQRKVSELKG
ncbi:MAG: tetratricopeptide repeat protein [Proteobacteria bacterium]|nr:tetratricopeptide repeat protein [Pseudomonadota bacterium]